MDDDDADDDIDQVLKSPELMCWLAKNKLNRFTDRSEPH
jgi:hypothetical protein